MNSTSVGTLYGPYIRDFYKDLPAYFGSDDSKWSANITSSRHTEILRKWLGKNESSLKELNKLVNRLQSQMVDSQDAEVVVSYGENVALWCANQGFIKYLQDAEELIKKHFFTVQQINFTVEYDPELEKEWISAILEVFGDIPQLIDCEENFVSEWVASVPYPERDNFSISFDII